MIMNKTIKLSAIACLALSAVQPALAAKTKNVTSSAVAAESGSAGAGSAQRSGAKKLCHLAEPVAGSRIAVHSCRTMGEWEAAGFELIVKK
jgi:hypothetical protein